MFLKLQAHGAPDDELWGRARAPGTVRQALKAMFDEVRAQPSPDHLLDLVDQLEARFGCKRRLEGTV